LQIAEIPLQLVGREVRVEGDADRGRCDSDNRNGIIEATRQYYCYAIPPIYAESS
jgi:hypothetical protein